jgi:hypothetical protein
MSPEETALAPDAIVCTDKADEEILEGAEERREELMSPEDIVVEQDRIGVSTMGMA